MRNIVAPFAFVVLAALAGCSSKEVVRCTSNADCLQGGVMGTCLDSPESSDKWCAFSDPNCAGSALRWGLATGDGLAAECVTGGGSVALDLSLEGGGGGLVVSEPSGIDCGESCSASFPSGSQVSLTATPEPSSWFMGFQGDCDGRSTCQLTLNAPTTVRASFELHGKSLGAGQFGGDLHEHGRAAAVAADGALYLAGIAGGFDSSADGQALIMKIDRATGSPTWTRFFTDGNASLGSVRALAIDPVTGDLIITGWFSGTPDFDGLPIDPDAGNLFVARLEPMEGHVAWVRQIGATQSQGPATYANIGVAVDLHGNVVVAASTARAFAFGTDTIPYHAGADAILVKLSAAGDPTFARAFGGAGDDLATTVAMDSAGDIYVGGSFEGMATFAGGVVKTSVGGGDGFVSKWTSTGGHAWTRTFGSEGADRTSAIATAGGRVFVSGQFVNEISLGGLQLSSVNNTADAFVGAYSASGTHLWSRTEAGQGAEEGLALCLDEDGALVVGTKFSAGLSVDTFSASGEGAAVATLAPSDGTLVSASELGIPNIGAVACGHNAILATGDFQGQIDIDGQILMSGENFSDLDWQVVVP
jgi:hypothetical protein